MKRKAETPEHFQQKKETRKSNEVIENENLNY